jgi:FixJ family two-component response regulator
MMKIVKEKDEDEAGEKASAGPRSRISIVDDDASVREALKGLMRSVGRDVDAFGSAEEFLTSGKLRETACLILDIRLPGMDGFELQERLQKEPQPIPVIFVSGHADEAARKKALAAGAVELLTKPLRRGPLFSAIESALDKRK